MIEKKRTVNKFWVGLFYVGFCSILLIAFYTLKDSAFESQAMLALTSSLIWFISAFLTFKIPNRPDREKYSHILMIGIGTAEIIMAILFWLIINPKMDIAIYVKFLNLVFSVYGLSGLYFTLITYFSPNLKQTISNPPPNPLAEFPHATQEIINKGKSWINGSFGVVVLAALLVGGIGSFIQALAFKNDSFSFFFICEGMGFIIGLVLSIIATFKWQKWALQSGIPADELKAAAKRANLWWPKIREE